MKPRRYTYKAPLVALQGNSHQEEGKQPHCRDTQRHTVMNYLGPPEAPDHMPLATLSVCQSSATTVARTSLKKTACLN